MRYRRWKVRKVVQHHNAVANGDVGELVPSDTLYRRTLCHDHFVEIGRWLKDDTFHTYIIKFGDANEEGTVRQLVNVQVFDKCSGQSTDTQTHTYPTVEYNDNQ